ncbi:MAG: large conductance mechanosensitive channel protein MscL [Candidatus Eremiobacteraeota bacterium]|nr:large conductance mechanosensitive channel protein MscL [Candidatus Eremiobacteraeota bacterium]
MFKGFGKFIMRGNVVDLAVAVVIGTAFGAVVTSLVKDLLTPIVAAIGGKPDFSTTAFFINGSRFGIGNFINAAITFVLVAAAVYFFVIVPINIVRERLHPGSTLGPKECPECLSEIPRLARRCKFCSAALGDGSATVS